MTASPEGLSWPKGLADRLCFGGDYNPEQWPEHVWADDVALMREAGVNLATVGVFSWARLEPEEGKYDFGWLDRVFDQLHHGGIKVVLATPTASPPPWFSVAHPDALPVRADGVRLTHGSRDTYCVSAPAYRAASARIATVLAERYGAHPALAMWHVHNEYGTWCYCDHTAAAFRDWLRARHGNLDALNEAWTTAFWSQHYSDWAQIMPPRATQYLSNPAHVLDFRRFGSDEMLAHYREARDILRAATPDTPVTTNFVFGSWVSVENWAWSSEVDLVAIDHYPSTVGGLGAEQETAFAADLARSWAGGRPWLLMEHAASVINTGGRMVTKDPGRMARLSLSHVARGSRGAMFFQWRASRGGAEQFHSAMVPHVGADTRVFREVTALGRVLAGLSEVAGEISAQVAIAWDAQAWWAGEGQHLPSPDVRALPALERVHAALWRAGITTDFAQPGADLSAYRLVLVPSLYLVTDEAAANLQSYVSGGGHLGVWYFSGIADEHAGVRLGGYPGAFREVLGVRVEEFHPLLPGDSVPLSSHGAGSIWTEHVHARGAEAVVHYAGGVLDGKPAITRNRFGAGTAWYVSTGLDEAGLTDLLATITAEAGVTPVLPGLPAGVEVVRRHGAQGRWLFAINHTDTAVELPVGGLDLVTGQAVTDALTLAPGAFAVLREP